MKVHIIGGGVIGLCTAYYLHKEGYQVEVIERGDFSDGCSHGNVGLVVPSHFIPLAAPGVISKGIKWMFSSASPFYIQPRLSLDLMGWLWHFYRSCSAAHVKNAAPVLLDFHMLSRLLYQELASELDFSYEEKGMLSVCKSPAALEEEIHMAEEAAKLGQIVKVLSGAELKTFDKGIEIEALGGVWYGADAHMHPGQLMKALHDSLIENGVVLRENTTVKGFVAEGNRIKALATESGEQIEVEQIVLSGGAWSASLLRSLGIYAPIQPAKGYSMTFAKPEKCPTIPTILAEAKVVLTPMGDELRIGGTLEMSDFNEKIKANRVQAILNAVPGYFPGYEPKMPTDEKIWSGFRPCSPDGLPYLGTSPKYANVIVAAGHAMLGISLGPATALLVSEMLGGKTLSIDCSLFGVERF